jgi:hypothetical protein
MYDLIDYTVLKQHHKDILQQVEKDRVIQRLKKSQKSYRKNQLSTYFMTAINTLLIHKD